MCTRPCLYTWITWRIITWPCSGLEENLPGVPLQDVERRLGLED
jgi:hypothetical protein